MFGYIRVQKSELLVREYDAYKAVYCGLCKCMGREYSLLSRFLLSYDCTFYAMFLMSLSRSCKGFDSGRCRFNPLKKCSFCKCEDDAIKKAAAMNVILSYYKLEDNIEDNGFFKRIACKIIRPVFSRWRKKAAESFPEIDEAAHEMMSSQREAESKTDCSLDMAAHPTAQMLATVLEKEDSGSQSRILHQIGYGLGRFVYLIDAVDDFNDDIKSNGFNALKNVDGDRLEVADKNLSQALAMVFEAYNLLDLVDFKGILDNILLKGLPSVQAEILRKVREKNERPV